MGSVCFCSAACVWCWHCIRNRYIYIYFYFFQWNNDLDFSLSLKTWLAQSPSTFTEWKRGAFCSTSYLCSTEINKSLEWNDMIFHCSVQYQFKFEGKRVTDGKIGRKVFQEAVSIKQLCGEGLYLLMHCITESLENASLLWGWMKKIWIGSFFK